MDDKFLIHIDIAGKSYGLRIDRRDEEEVRKAANLLRTKMTQYRLHFNHADISEKDLLAMVALQLSISNLRLEEDNDTTQFMMKIEQLTADLEREIEQNWS
jgi:cell division protein ZapA